MRIWANLVHEIQEAQSSGWTVDQIFDCDTRSLWKVVYDSVCEAGHEWHTEFFQPQQGDPPTHGAIELGRAFGQATGEFGQASFRIRWFPPEIGSPVRVVLRLRRDHRNDIARLVHDLRTPLAAMVSAAERSLEPGIPASGLSADLQTIARAGRGLLAQVESLLGTDPRLPSEPPTEWDPTEVAAEAVDLLAPSARVKGLDLRLTPGGPVRRRSGDAAPFRRILSNLIGNAVKYSDRGTIEVAVHQQGGNLVASVRDEGPGIEPDLLHRILQPGVRGPQAIERGIEGHGLGLSNVRDLVADLGGTLAIESLPGEGATFTVRVPDRVEAPRLEGLRILLVDDGEDNRRLLAHHVQVAGAEALPAADGFIAESMARAARPDVLLVDLAMPGRDGVATLQALRSSGVNAPALALTASTDLATAEGAIRAGFTRVLTKPVDRDSLRRAIREAIRVRAAA